MTDLRYPIGPHQRQDMITEHERKEFIKNIAETPGKLRDAVRGLSADQLETRYREGGWTVRQVIHHVPDSHLNAYIRTRLTLTEEKPTIKTYHENLWAELLDARTAPVDTSLMLLESLHKRWVMLLESLKPEDFSRPLNHPEHGVMKLDDLIHLYSWHGRHHVAQITSLRERMGWK
jgi:uncharacterized damage-inducible protein DinB